MKRFFFILIILSGITVLKTFGQIDSINYDYAVSDTLEEDIKLFDSDELLEITLKFDITSYKRKKSDEEYLDAVMTYHIGPADSVVKTLRVKPRGIMRLSICDFPPLMLNFHKEDSVGKEFSRVDKLKMVTHCSAGGEEYLLKEFLIYKLYNVLTDYSFRVRLLRVNYINTFKESKPIKSFAFVIEPIETLGKRLNAVEVKTTMNITQKHIRPEVMDRMAIFNYMIGNTDWTVPIFHNNVIVLSQNYSQGPESGIAVAYDFDYAGLVNTSYAVPADALGLKSVLERRYLGMCRSEETFINALKEFSDKKEDLYKVINDFQYLNPKVKKQMITYLEGFYSGFDKRNSIVFKLRSECLNF